MGEYFEGRGRIATRTLLKGLPGVASCAACRNNWPAMARQSGSEDSSLARLWSRLGDPECAVLIETWPDNRHIPFLQALEEESPGRAAALRQQFDLIQGLLQVPIVAVAGLLNAGKSSLVASFLSESGRKRVLRGVTRAAGTHRFILWCPKAWGDNEGFRASLERLLASVFGQPAIPLASDPEQAHAQQRERGKLSSPLLAFDSGLDAHGICLLDCPDIQRHEEGDAAGLRQRRQMLEGASRICSAVFVVLPRSELEVEQVSEVLTALPRALRVLLVNFCSGESPAEIAAEARAAWGDVAQFIYVAYDFRHRGYENSAPEWDPNLRLRPEDYTTEAVPCFFMATSALQGAEASPEGSEASLAAFAHRVMPEQLLQERQRELVRELRSHITAEGERFAGAAVAHADQLRLAATRLREELTRLLEHEGQARIKMDPGLIEDFAASIRRTAPWDLKPFLWMSQRAAVAIRSIRSLVRGISEGISERVHEEGRRIGERLADGRIDEHRIADRLRLWSAGLGQVREPDYWLPVAQRILSRFQERTSTRPPAGEWDERASELWRAMPVWRARAAVGTTVLVALAGVALLSVAGGPILVALGLKSAALTVTAKELLVVIGLGSIAQGEAARRLDEWLHERIGSEQQAALIGIAMAELGIPPGESGLGDSVVEPAGEPRRDGFVVRVLGLKLRRWHQENWRRIEQELTALEQGGPGSRAPAPHGVIRNEETRKQIQ